MQAQSNLEALVYNDPTHPKFLEYFSKILMVVAANNNLGEKRCAEADLTTLVCIELILEEMEAALKG